MGVRHQEELPESKKSKTTILAGVGGDGVEFPFMLFSP